MLGLRIVNVAGSLAQAVPQRIVRRKTLVAVTGSMRRRCHRKARFGQNRFPGVPLALSMSQPVHLQRDCIGPSFLFRATITTARPGRFPLADQIAQFLGNHESC